MKEIIKSIHFPKKEEVRTAFLFVCGIMVAISAYLFGIDSLMKLVIGFFIN